MDLMPAQVEPPHVDATYLLALVSRVAHILGAIILLGGISYLRKVVAPATARRASPGKAQNVRSLPAA